MKLTVALAAISLLAAALAPAHADGDVSLGSAFFPRPIAPCTKTVPQLMNELTADSAAVFFDWRDCQVAHPNFPSSWFWMAALAANASAYNNKQGHTYLGGMWLQIAVADMNKAVVLDPNFSFEMPGVGIQYYRAVEAAAAGLN